MALYPGRRCGPGPWIFFTWVYHSGKRRPRPWPLLSQYALPVTKSPWQPLDDEIEKNPLAHGRRGLGSLEPTIALWWNWQTR